MKQFALVVEASGTIRMIYDDDLVDLLDEGVSTVERASFVEPTAPTHDLFGGWTADLTPSNGPVLGPFLLRDDALKQERAWIEEKLIG